MTVREGLLALLFSHLEGAASGLAADSVIATRNGALTERLDEVRSVWLNLIDGSADGPPDALMGNPGSWAFTHMARLEIYVRGDDGADRDALFDQAVGIAEAAIATDPTLGGGADLVEAQSVEEPAMDVLGLTIGFKTGIVPVLILYDAPTRAG
jgi:hypothetical protein